MREQAHYSRLLHIVVGDMNVEDAWLSIPYREVFRERYADAEPWEYDIFDALATLSEAERASAIAMQWGYFDEFGNLRPDIAAYEEEMRHAGPE